MIQSFFFVLFRFFMVILVLLPFLSGCMVGPDFKQPETELPAQWVGEAPKVADKNDSPDLDLARWWLVFHDPQLASLVERAMAANLDLQKAESRIRQARAAMRLAGADLGPSIDAGASYKRSRTPSLGSDGGKVTTNLYQMGFDASWEIDIFGGTRRGVEAAGADYTAAVESRRDLLVSLSAEVANSYLNLRSLQQRLAITRQNLRAQEHSARLTRERFDAGFVGKLDVTQAEALVATTASQVPLLESSIRQTIYGLSLLLGGEPSLLLAELNAGAPLPSVMATVPAGLPSELLLRRPDIRMAEAKMHAATARVGVAQADLFPKFVISGTLGLQSNTLNALSDRAGSFWSFGPAIQWPVFDMGRNQANLELKKEILEEELLSYRQSVLSALQEVENALVASSREEEHRQDLLRVVAANRASVDLATTLYTEGQSDFLAVLDAQRSLFAAEDSLAQSNRTVATNLVALFKALGGGWSEAEVNQNLPDSAERKL